MAASTSKSAFWTGLRDGAPFVLVAFPFATLFGVVGTEAGLNFAQVMGFSVVVVAGAAQFAALQLMTENAPTIMVLITALAVNMRMAMYSAAMTPHLGKAPLKTRVFAAYVTMDQNVALSLAAYEEHLNWTIGQKLGYYFGAVALLLPCWFGGTVLGALAGEAIPAEYGLDFALPITFLAMIGPMLRTVPHMLTAATSIVVALLLASVPFGMGLLLAGLAAMIVGAEAERRMA